MAFLLMLAMLRFELRQNQTEIVNKKLNSIVLSLKHKIYKVIL